MNVGILTSSRADYSIYFPLLKALRNAPRYQFSIMAFGSHLSTAHGYTAKQIEEDGFIISHRVPCSPAGDTPAAINLAMSECIQGFTKVWQSTKVDLLFCLGDRYEMFAACASSVPFGIPLAHIHGGEETLGAIDNVFRHSITHMARYHFTTAEPYQRKVQQLTGSPYVYNVGSLSIDNLATLDLLTKEEFKHKYNIDLQQPSILITFHPETVLYQENERYMRELLSALDEITGYQYIFTMPNTDTASAGVRKAIVDYVARSSRSKAVESFGTIGYLSCMKHCAMMLGNTSSGFVEASWFPKYVINLGVRQQGRIETPNINTCHIEKNEIIKAVQAYDPTKLPQRIRAYGDGHAAQNIIQKLDEIK